MDSDKTQAGIQSSFLVHPVAIAIWVVVCVWSALLAHTLLAVFSGFIFALTLCSLVWGRLSLRGVRYELTIPQSELFPGQSLWLTRTVYNGKMLPLLWLELLEPCDPDGCAVPDSKFIVPNPEATEEKPEDAWRCLYSFALLKWHQTLTFSDLWTAKHRGIHRVAEITIRSGDGFSLCTAGSQMTMEPARQIVVYPQLTEVSVDAILNNMWDSRSRSSGYLEDVTLMKSVRDYTVRDPARRINQRLLARGQGLKVNQYEVVTPSDVLFALDAASFKGRESEAFERVLSILASLITGLSQRGIQVGLLAPRSAYFPQTYVKPAGGEAELRHMLTLLAAAGQADLPLTDSVDAAAPELLGQVYYVAFSEKAATSLRVLAQVPPHKAELLVFETGEPAEGHALRAREITQFWRAS